MMKQEEGKYIVDLIPKWVEGKIVVPKVEEKMLKEDVEMMLPEGFAFMNENASGGHWEWVKNNQIGQDTIVCEMSRGRKGGAKKGPDGEWMEVWYYTYHVSLWYKSGNGMDTKMDVVCRDIAMMIEDKYGIKQILEDKSILNKNPQEVQDYLDDLAIAVCINGDRLEKYEKLVIKRCGSEEFANMKLFVEEVKRSMEREKFTNTSKVNLDYLGKNAGLSEQTIEKIVKYCEQSIVVGAVAPSASRPQSSSMIAPTAIPALVIGILSISLSLLVIPGIIMSIIGKRKAKEGYEEIASNPNYRGEGMLKSALKTSRIGFILSFVSIPFWILYFMLLFGF